MKVKFRDLEHKAMVFLSFAYAFNAAGYSPDKRLQVGCSAFSIRNQKILATSFNSKPIHSRTYLDCVNPATDMSHEDLLHAEAKILFHLGASGTKNVSMSVTTAPCRRCAGFIAHTNMKDIYYLGTHDNNDGIRVLNEDYGIFPHDCSNHEEDIVAFSEYFNRTHDSKVCSELPFEQLVKVTMYWLECNAPYLVLQVLENIKLVHTVEK